MCTLVGDPKMNKFEHVSIDGHQMSLTGGRARRRPGIPCLEGTGAKAGRGWGWGWGVGWISPEVTCLGELGGS